MEIQNSIATAFLFLCYVLLWNIKRKEILKSENIDVNVIFKATKPIQKYFGILEKFMTIAIVIIIFANGFLITSKAISWPLIA